MDSGAGPKVIKNNIGPKGPQWPGRHSDGKVKGRGNERLKEEVYIKVPGETE